MRKPIPKSLTLPLLIAASLSGCFDRVAGGAGAGNPPLAEVTVALQAKVAPGGPKAKTAAAGTGALDSALAVKDSAGGILILSAIEVRVARIEFTAPDSATCGKSEENCLEKEFGLKGEFAMDLISGRATPPIGIFRLPAGTYTQIGLTPAATDPNASPAKPGYNFLVAGKTGGTAPDRAFTIEISLEEGLDFQDSAGIRIAKDSANNIILALKVDAWFKEMNMGACLDRLLPDSLSAYRLRENGPCAEGLRAFKAGIGQSEEIDHED